MKKFLISIICTLCVGSAFAAGENVATSKAFVDTAVAQKQDKIPANSGVPQVLTNTGTAGTVGTKDIYDSSAAYSAQMESLVDAATMNAAVQAAIDTEFECISWANPNDRTSDCMLVQIRGALPSGYTALKYLESDGGQYIDTGIVPTNSTGISIKFNRYSSSDQVVVGVVTSAENGNIYVNPANHILMPFGEGWNAAVFEETVNNTDYDVQLNFMNDRKRYINGVAKLDITHTLAEYPYTIYMFAASASGPAWYFFNGRIYYLKITDGRDIVRNFIPARRDIDGVLGMYDTMTNTFLTNSGTGNFIAGPMIYMPSGN